MHDNEFNIDETLVTNLLKQQYPELAELPLAKIKHYGTDNAILRVGDKYAIRLPRVEYAAEQIEKEIVWLPKFISHLALTIPSPIHIGKPSNDFPHSWYLYHWIEGEDAYNTPPQNLNQFASDLAGFIKALWKVDIAGAPLARRGLPLKEHGRDEWVYQSISELKRYMDDSTLQHCTDIWEETSSTPLWHKPPVWLHADLLPSNLLLLNDKLHAVIDFGLMGIGDPACDLIPAWCLFDRESRMIFKESLNVDENTWIRGKGWALSIALIIMPYYKDTNPVLMSVARRIIGEITHEL